MKNEKDGEKRLALFHQRERLMAGLVRLHGTYEGIARAMAKYREDRRSLPTVAQGNRHTASDIRRSLEKHHLEVQKKLSVQKELEANGQMKILTTTCPTSISRP